MIFKNYFKIKEMTEKIKQLILQGEGIEIEFKESYKSLTRSVYETLCAFLSQRRTSYTWS